MFIINKYVCQVSAWFLGGRLLDVADSNLGNSVILDIYFQASVAVNHLQRMYDFINQRGRKGLN
ncbi:hypothetical protein A3H89_03695 [Candidatus Amesbacteria bacterium RIFCSPLOWO2_02_FULL_48_11]|nr:MAG: hypothetical protein A3H89_03695 [Candidatus Amesbacteria bacterium RIFCSPLOWO2_02_FULL_48_11]